MSIIARNKIYLMANGTGVGPEFYWTGGQGMFQAEWTGGASVTLEMKGPAPSSTTWTEVGEFTTLDASGSGAAFTLPPGTVIRCNAGANTGCYAVAKAMK